MREVLSLVVLVALVFDRKAAFVANGITDLM